MSIWTTPGPNELALSLASASGEELDLEVQGRTERMAVSSPSATVCIASRSRLSGRGLTGITSALGCVSSGAGCLHRSHRFDHWSERGTVRVSTGFDVRGERCRVVGERSVEGGEVTSLRSRSGGGSLLDV